MGGRSVRVFHISDLHMRSAEGPQAERARLEAASRWRVLGEKWTAHLTELRKDGVPFDLVVFTGDLGDWGHPTDYPRAFAFLKETCAALDVPLDRLFVIPGNHDVDRNAQAAAWKWVRKNIGDDPRGYSEWMAGIGPRELHSDARRDKILERQQAFWAAVAGELGRSELQPRHSPHHRLGYRQAVTLPGLSQPIQVIGLDTVWLAGDEHDSGALRLTEHQVSLLTTDEGGAPLSGFRLALMHHRLADLADAADTRRLMAERVDLLLHGHQHEPAADLLQGPDHQLLVLATGCLYEGDEGPRFPNACQVIDLMLDEQARPRGAAVRFRGWSERGLFWGDDALLYERARGGRLRLDHGVRGWFFDDDAQVPRQREPAPHKVFVGRDIEMERIGAAFDRGTAERVALVALQGMAGVGKTYLAHEFYARCAGRFGSYQHVVFDPERPGTVATWLSALGERAGMDPSRVRGPAVAAVLGAQRALVHVDNVDSVAAAALVVELADALDGVPMLVTGRYTELGTAADSDWTRIELAPLVPETALELLHSELQGTAVEVVELRELVRQVAGLPLALHLAAGYLRRVTMGRFLERLRAEGFALGPKDPSDHLRRERARGVLSTSFAISRELLLTEAGTRAPAWEAALAAIGWAPGAGFGRSLGAAITSLETAAFEDFIEAAAGLSLVQGLRPEEGAGAAWTVHPLLSEFLRMGTERREIDDRIGEWVAERADRAESERARRWDELSAEAGAIGEWLGGASGDVVGALLPRAWQFAVSRGPVALWLIAAQRVRSGGAASREVLWTICQLAMRAGELEVVRDAASEMERLAQMADDDHHRALALGKIADVLTAQGELDEALRIRAEELPVYNRLGDVRMSAITLGKIADVHYNRGELDEALRIRREEELPIYERLGDRRSRAITLRQIADVLYARGELDEALRIHREEELPDFDTLGDVRERTITLGKIADVLHARGSIDEALRIRREEQLPIFERLGDVREYAITLGQIADVLCTRGELDEALRIWREEQLPIFERLGDVRERAITSEKIAHVLFIRGEFDEALRIRREEELPVFERLGDVRGRAVALRGIADVLFARGELDEALRILREVLSAFERLGSVRERAVTLGKIADVLFVRGELEEVLRIRREEQLTVYQRLGDVQEYAATWGRIADVLFARGELEEVLRIRREEELPIYDRLGNVHARAVALGRIADVLIARGELDEALRIRQEEVLPVYERLGDIRSLAITLGKIADVLVAQGELDEALRMWREALAVFERLAAPDLIVRARQRIAGLQTR